jgi:broad specificity phosphatase PhoE
MTTTLFLVRHAAHDLLGRVLTGRMPGVRLGAEGRRQSGLLADRLSREDISAVYTSPLERARETAAPIAARLDIEPETVDDLTDVDYGEWSGLQFEALDEDARWASWNRARSTYRPPGGETMLDVQHRAVASVERIVAANPERRAVVVSHGDVIRVVLAYFLGLAIDHLTRFEISPASISSVAVGDWGGTVLGMNEVVAA